MDNILEYYLVKLNEYDFINYLFNNNYIKNNVQCIHCPNDNIMQLIQTKKVNDGFIWKCKNPLCYYYNNSTQRIRNNSFFKKFNIPIIKIIIIIIRYSYEQPLYSILKNLKISPKTLYKIINNLILLMGKTNFYNNKLGGPNTIAEIDETRLTYLVKSHKGIPSKYKVDALVIVELINNKIVRGLSIIIPNKFQKTILPLILNNVKRNTIIHTDESKIYINLYKYGYTHQTVCHKLHYVDYINNVNSQAAESFNNLIKLEIKKRKGIKHHLKKKFINEFNWKFNNKIDRTNKLLNLIKIH